MYTYFPSRSFPLFWFLSLEDFFRCLESFIVCLCGSAALNIRIGLVYPGLLCRSGWATGWEILKSIFRPFLLDWPASTEDSSSLRPEGSRSGRQRFRSWVKVEWQRRAGQGDGLNIQYMLLCHITPIFSMVPLSLMSRWYASPATTSPPTTHTR